MKPTAFLAAENAAIRQQLAAFQRELAQLRAQVFTREQLRRAVFQLRAKPVQAPDWAIRPWRHGRRDPGIPVLSLGDVHFGEVVDPAQVNGINRFDTAVANTRLRLFAEKAIHLCRRHIGLSTPRGAVLCLLGDFFSGEIHRELAETNQISVPQALLELEGILCWIIQELVKAFGRLHVVAVAGNHGRLDEKPRAKDAVFRNWDWLLYCHLERYLSPDRRITWNVSSSLDAHLRVYGTRFLVTHGDQFRGGSGIQSGLSPWFIGDYKKRKQQRALGQDYDYLLMGHWHQLAAISSIIVNGSVKGFDEYALKGHFPFEPPQQWLWIVRPDGRIPYWLPIFLDRR